ncbi:hypothetical protein [Caulobacter sp. S45]|uniref:hypothetical protein n=1 Tax=Caulobacter sp. S45 TaxID=1641861 RepID=UPI00131B3B36|nr:hypothetical protein [Caulobacter sp. S45]
MAADRYAELQVKWRANWLGSIEEISNLEMQRATWLNPDNSNPHYTFIEYTSCYFDGLVVNEGDGGYVAALLKVFCQVRRLMRLRISMNCLANTLHLTVMTIITKRY